MNSLKHLLVLCVCFSSLHVYSAEEPYINELKGTGVAANNFFYVSDEKFNNSTSWNTIRQHFSVENLVTFEINFDTTVYFYSTPFSCTINFKIYLYGNQSDTSIVTDSTTHSNISLTVRYDTVTGRPYKGIALYKFNGSHKYKIKILSITSAEFGSSIPAIFRLKGEIFTNRQYKFQDQSLDTTRFSVINTNQLLLQWTPSNYIGAERFDLEYTHIDISSEIGAIIAGYNVSGYYDIPENILSQWFRNNSSRITTAASNYLLNIPYDSGFILFRIRGVQDSVGVRIEGNWNYNARGIALSCSDCPTGVVFFNGHETLLNWQYSVVFAEEGKRKEVISYFDGTLRNRQSVTLNNSDNKNIVQETIYDALGRPVLNILPSPTLDSTIHYFKAFNRNGGGTNPYSFADLDFVNCQTEADTLSSVSGTGRYYSPSNDFLGSFYYSKYIPDAEGSPYTVTEYMADHTGRIKGQSGVGSTFQLGSTHETRYFYGKPLQSELDRLFGLEAGSSSHYLKNMVIDPNGQVSVSYLDASGKTVATALAGTSPQNLHELPSVAGSTINSTNTLLAAPDFSRNPDTYNLIGHATFLAPITGNYIFHYYLDSLVYRKLYGPARDTSFCSNCYYELEILIRDDCANVLRRDTVPAGNVFDTTCSTPPSSIRDSIHVNISKVGEYYVSYNLVISQDALKYYDSVHLVKNSDIRKLEDFFLDELKETDFYGCYSNCKTCISRLGTVDEFRENFKILYLRQGIVFSNDDSIWVDGLYDSLYTRCQNLQEGCSDNVCDEKLEILKRDVSPGGQYAQYDESYNLLETPINVIAQRSSINWFPDEFGNRDSVMLVDQFGEDSLRVDVTQLNDSSFIKYWQDSWADSLVTLHPEYCFYLWCIANSTSYEFDRLIDDMADGDAAKENGWFDPDDREALLNSDPFFNSGGAGVPFKDKMSDSLTFFSRTMMGYANTDKNILEFVNFILYCKKDTACYAWNNCDPDPDCRSWDREWFYYKTFYLNLKQQFYERARRTSSNPIFSNCTNCFIGNDILGSSGDVCMDTCHNNSFQKVYGGTGDDYAYDTRVLPSGGMIVAGKTNSFGAGGFDGYVLKLNSKGEVQWAKTVGGSKADSYRRIELVRGGGYIAIGTTKSFRDTTGSNILVTRFAPNGNILWSKEYWVATTSVDEGMDICQVSDGNFVFCARTSADAYRVVLKKINSSGVTIWTRRLQFGTAAQVMDINASTDTSFILSGNYFKDSTNYTDGFLVKGDHRNSNIIWVKGYDIENRDNYASEMHIQNNQYYFKTWRNPLSGPLDTVYTSLSTDFSGTVQLRRDLNTFAGLGAMTYPDRFGNVIFGQHTVNYNADILYYYKMNSAGTLTRKITFPKLAGFAVIEKVEPAPGNTSVLAGNITETPGSTDLDIWIFKSSADTANFTTCGFTSTTGSTSQPTVNSYSISYLSTNFEIDGPSDTAVVVNNPSTTIDTLCSDFNCEPPPNSCDTLTWEPYVDPTCTTECDPGLHNPYDRDSIMFYVEYGSPQSAPTSVPAGYGNCRFYPSITIQKGPSSFCRFLNVWVCTYDSTCTTGGVCPETAYPSQCSSGPNDSLYENKIRRYPEYVNMSDFYASLQYINPQQGSDENEELILQECASICDAQADIWMNTLRRCNNMSYSDSVALRSALIEICTKGCSLDRPFGASSIPNSISATYHSFEEAITAIIGSPAPNDSCTTELLAMPYPYDRQPVFAEKLITESDSTICARLAYYDSLFQITGGENFYQFMVGYLGNSFTLDSTELDDLLNSCNNCNYILKNDLVLPAPLIPGTRLCLPCDTLGVALEDFVTKFPGLDPTSEFYEALFTNFFNHRFGYSRNYFEYRQFLDSCDSIPSYEAVLCDVPMQEDVLIDPAASCIAELFASALSTAYNLYVVYIDSVRKDFQESYITRCMNAQPHLTMTSDITEYHYTLYYYDQSGNLVKTIPPEGVDVLDVTETGQVAQYRSSGTNNYCNNNNSINFGSAGGSVIFPSGSSVPQINTGNQPFTVEFWMKLSTFANQGVLSNNYTASDGLGGYYDKGYAVNIKSGKLILLMGEGLTQTTGVVEAESLPLSGLISLNSWNHFALERTNTGSGVRIYINGNLVPVSYLRNSFVTGNIDNGNSVGFYTGRAFSGGTTLTLNNGNLKHIRIYKRALPQAEVRQNYFDFCGNPSNSDQLNFWAAFNEGAWIPVSSQSYVYDRIYSLGGYAGGTSQNFEHATSTLVPAHRLATTYQYNSLNQVLQQYSPDGDTSKFYYDRLGRLIASQNKEQKENSSYSGSANRYSYTLYDSLGRITEVGEKNGATSIHTLDLLDTTVVKNWLASGTDRQVTKTMYDDPVNLNYQDYNSSRKRVVASIYFESKSDTEGDSTLYNYDILGNVKTLVQHVKALVALDATNGKKRVDYDYDLVSGKVNAVAYQQGKGDQFFYKYSYDADNRVTRSYSSRDRLVWIEDASYRYYLHGPLARTELGQYKVQGVDYSYTLQGWLKGINSDSLSQFYDMAKDGWQNTTFGRVSRDVYAFKIGYYGGDYEPIGSDAAAFAAKTYSAPGSLSSTGNPLYNGNISLTTLTLSKIGAAATVGYSYGYDQLNRLREMRQHGTNAAGGWSNSDIITAYRESITYDANGNILKYLRKGHATTPHMDSLTYKYNYASGNLVNNKLNHVKDSIPASNYTVDIDDQEQDNYTYDLIGNLKTDVAEDIANIDWTVYGKIKGITKKVAGVQVDYSYDAGGNRTYKYMKNGEGYFHTFYIRDAQGNILAVYSKKDEDDILWDEQHLYGSSRLGMWNADTTVPSLPPNVISTPVYDSIMLGSRHYELTNHLGNVLSTISDKKIGNDSSGTVNYYIAEVLSQNDYYPFGMGMVGRQYQAGSSSYRYGLMGKEKSNEIYGEGNAYDFGSRMHDPRIGRWFSVDPVQKKYPGWSPYNFVMNSPLKLKDEDGEDVIVTINGNSITFSSTIYVIGPGATDVAKNANDSYSEFSKAALQNRTYKDAEGKVYNVQIKMNFVAVNPADPKDPNLAAYNSTINDKVGGSGNNVLNLTNNKSNLVDGTRANAGHAAGTNYSNTKEDFIAGNGMVQTRYVKGVGNMAWLNQDKTAKDNGVTGIHETLHNFGLGDRRVEHVAYSAVTSLSDGIQILETFNDMTVAYPGFENDMMNNNSFNLNQTHIDNLASAALELSKTKGSNFVMAQKVDNASVTDKASAPKTFTRGKTTYTKKEETKPK